MVRINAPTWTWLITTLLFIMIIWLPAAPMHEDAEALPLTAYESRMAVADGFQDAYDIIMGRCSTCHTREPVWKGLFWARKRVLLETVANIARTAKAIYLQAGITHAMPPANVTYIEPEDPAAIVRWYRTVVNRPAEQ